jgi:hypothetical protein
MEPSPVSGYPENPEKKKRLEQLKILIERHNFLIDQVNILEKDFEEKDKKLTLFKYEMKEDLEEQKKMIEQTHELIKETERIKKVAGKDFKEIVKKPIYEKLEKRINNLGYEDYIYREELMRKLHK